MKLSKSDVLFVVILLLIISLLVVMLYRSLNRTLDAGNRTPIGTIVFKERIAERRFKRNTIWENLRNENPVYNGDTIRTADLSEAEIILNDGTSVALEQNTLIVLNFTDEAIIQFSQGGIRTSGDQFKVEANGNEIKLSGANARLSSDKNQGLEISVTEGTASVEQNGETTQITKNQSGQFADGKSSVTTIPVVLNQPIDGERRIIDKEKDTIQFTWQSQKPVLFELSRSVDFKNPIRQQTTATTTSMPLEKGSYYWRLSIDGKPTPPRSFLILQKKQIDAYTPTQRFTTNTKTNQADISFSWSAVSNVSSYELVITNETTGEVIKKRSMTQLLNLSLPTGNYSWQVLPNEALTEMVNPSPKQSFSIQNVKASNPPTPLSPSNATVLQSLVADRGLVFNWSSDIQNARYQFQIARDAQFTTVLVEKEVTGSSFYLRQLLPEGTVYWRIVDGTTPSQSRAFQIIKQQSITLTSPVKGQVVTVDADQPIPVRWQAESSFASTFELSISTDQNFETANHTTMTGESASVSLSQGNYYWKISQKDASGRILGESTVEKFTVRYRPKPPVLLLPQPNQAVNMTNNNAILFSWRPVNEAISYQFRLFKEPNHQLIFEKATLMTSLTFNALELLNTGTFSWSVDVRTKDNAAQSEQSQRYFSITLNPIDNPEFTSPDTIFIK